MRVYIVTLFIAAFFSLGSSRAQLVLNDLSSHSHGYGDLFVEFQDKSVFMVLEVPAWDIAGFEGEPKNDEQARQIEAAEDRLFEAGDLFMWPDESGCSINRSSVTRISETLQTAEDIAAEQGDTDTDTDTETDTGTDTDADAATETSDTEPEETEQPAPPADHNDGLHSAFIAEYSIVCKKLDRFDSLTFAYFDEFPNAVALTVIISTKKGEFAVDVDRSNNVIDLKDLR